MLEPRGAAVTATQLQANVKAFLTLFLLGIRSQLEETFLGEGSAQMCGLQCTDVSAKFKKYRFKLERLILWITNQK